MPRVYQLDRLRKGLDVIGFLWRRMSQCACLLSAEPAKPSPLDMHCSHGHGPGTVTMGSSFASGRPIAEDLEGVKSRFCAGSRMEELEPGNWSEESLGGSHGE